MMEKNKVCRLTFACRDIGYGVEEGSVVGYWTGEVDTWGKYAIQVILDLCPRVIYLFPDEIVDVADA